jgi:uncharacterized protein YacL
MRTALVILHAAPGLLALAAGIPALSPRPSTVMRWLRHVYTACVAVLVAGLVILLIYDWPDLDTAPRVAFAGLTLLAGVIVYRLWRSYVEDARRREGWQTRYVDHVYFTYVSMWIGLFVVPLLGRPLPHITIPVMIVVVLVIGHVLLTAYKRRLTKDEVNS